LAHLGWCWCMHESLRLKKLAKTVKGLMLIAYIYLQVLYKFVIFIVG
ncbi:MAG: hypothetical protein ACI9T7_002787, partial [Oleiphilaceae bacterium]